MERLNDINTLEEVREAEKKRRGERTEDVEHLAHEIAAFLQRLEREQNLCEQESASDQFLVILAPLVCDRVRLDLKAAVGECEVDGVLDDVGDVFDVLRREDVPRSVGAIQWRETVVCEQRAVPAQRLRHVLQRDAVPLDASARLLEQRLRERPGTPADVEEGEPVRIPDGHTPVRHHLAWGHSTDRVRRWNEWMK